MAKEKTCTAQAQLEENGIVLDCKWAFNPVGVYKPQRRKLLQLMKDLDATQYCNRFKWVGCPAYLPDYIIEQMLYWRGALVFFKQGTEFRLLPYANAGSPNTYNMASKVQPIAYNGEVASSKDVNLGSPVDVDNYGDLQKVYDSLDEKQKKGWTLNKGVILFDRQNGMVTSAGMIPKSLLQDYVIEQIVNRFCFLNINLVNSQGKNIILVKDPKQKGAVEKALNNLYSSDKAYAMVKSIFDVQVINNEITYEEQALWEDIASWNSLRLEALGIDNNGLFNKKERQLTIESTADGSQTEVVSDAFYESRKRFVKLVKDVFADDPDFERDFANFDVIDLRLTGADPKSEKVKDDSEEDSDEEYGNTMF